MKGDTFSIDFSEVFYDQMIFMTGDCKKWVKMSKDQLEGDFDTGMKINLSV